uniref:hypothetical protein n=1 Tax=Citrobacter portucalensis TaxID=1639133 RepID=UPI002175DDD7|nr:hypothetical protein [Citrobacter portucalensis]
MEDRLPSGRAAPWVVKILQLFMVRLSLNWSKQLSFISELKLRMKSRMKSSMPDWTVIIEV